MEGGRQVTIATGTGRADGSVQLGDSILQVPGFTATDGQLVRLLLAYGAVVPLTGGSSSGGGGGPHAHPEYVEAAGDRMTGQLVVPSLGVVDEGDGQGQAPRFIVDAGPAGQNLIIGRPDGSGLAVGSADGLGYLHTGGGDYYRLLDVRDAGTLNAYLPTMYPETGQPGDLNSLDAGAYMVHGASTPYPSNMPRPFIVGDGDWLILAYGDAPIGNVGLGSAWQLALHHGEVYVRAASFMSPDTGWEQVAPKGRMCGVGGTATGAGARFAFPAGRFKDVTAGGKPVIVTAAVATASGASQRATLRVANADHTGVTVYALDGNGAALNVGAHVIAYQEP